MAQASTATTAPGDPAVSWRDTVRRLLPQRRAAAACCPPARTEASGLPIIALVGSPNVGKSVTFGRLTGQYAAVSNYPGTTVEVARGRARLGDLTFEVVDTPGMYSLLPITEEERVARSILISERLAVVLHVVDAKNLERMLPFTLQLLEAGLPVVLNLNLMDEAERLGIKLDLEALERRLGTPVVGTTATSGRGLEELRRRLYERGSGQPCPD